MEKEKIVIEYSNKMVVLEILPFDGDIDIDSLLKIDYSNIFGEIITWPVIFNRIANLRAESEHIVKMAKLDLDLFEAQLTEDYQKKISSDGTKATNKLIEAKTLRDPKFIAKKKDLINKERDFAYMDALYWSAQSKDTKLNKLSEKIRPEEFEKEIMEETINGVQIKVRKKAIR